MIELTSLVINELQARASTDQSTNLAVPGAPTKDLALAEVRDKVGRVIPECCLAIWNRRQEIQDHLTTISRIKTALCDAQEGQDLLYAETNFSRALAHLNQAFTEIKTALPYAVCPFCQGHLAQNCQLCKGRGLISQFRWAACVPEEMKGMVMRGLHGVQSEG